MKIQYIHSPLSFNFPCISFVYQCAISIGFPVNSPRSYPLIFSFFLLSSILLLNLDSMGCKLSTSISDADVDLQQRTTCVLSSVASCTEPIQFLLEVTGGLLDLNREMLSMPLDARKDICNSPDLFQLVMEYLDTSIESLEFCNCLESCLKRARDSQTCIQLALNKFEEESCDQENNFSLTLQELERFKQIGEPFTPEFFQALESVKKKHQEMLEKLEKIQQRKNKLDKKLKSIKSWRKISRLIFVAAFVAVVLFSIVVAAVSVAPLVAPLVTALVKAAMVVPVGLWIDSLFKGYKDAIKREKKEISDLSIQSMGISGVNSIKTLTENLEIQTRSMLDNTNSVLTDNEAVRLGMEEIKRKMGDFTNSVEQLEEKNDQYRQHIRCARDLVLTKIINKLTKAD